MSEDTIALIDQLVKEHQVIGHRSLVLEKVANDAEAIAGMDKAKENFVPGRLDQKKGLEQFFELLETYSEGLDAHFKREETSLLKAFEEYGDSELVSALHSLLDEHAELKERITEMKKHALELLSGELASHFWSAKAHDMRVYMGHTVKMIGVHAHSEFRLFTALKKQLQAES
ncbi:hypothetical protein ACFLXH_03055 [Chloroflexota bacterium]